MLCTVSCNERFPLSSHRALMHPVLPFNAVAFCLASVFTVLTLSVHSFKVSTHSVECSYVLTTKTLPVGLVQS